MNSIEVSVPAAASRGSSADAAAQPSVLCGCGQCGRAESLLKTTKSDRTTLPAASTKMTPGSRRPVESPTSCHRYCHAAAAVPLHGRRFRSQPLCGLIELHLMCIALQSLQDIDRPFYILKRTIGGLSLTDSADGLIPCGWQ